MNTKRWTRATARKSALNRQDAIARGMAGSGHIAHGLLDRASVLYKASAAKSPSSSPTSAPMRSEYLSFVSADNYVGAYDDG